MASSAKLCSAQKVLSLLRRHKTVYMLTNLLIESQIQLKLRFSIPRNFEQQKFKCINGQHVCGQDIPLLCANFSQLPVPALVLKKSSRFGAGFLFQLLRVNSITNLGVYFVEAALKRTIS